MGRYSYDGLTPRVDEHKNKEFMLLFKRGILIALQQEGVLSVAQLEQCIALLEACK